MRFAPDLNAGGPGRAGAVVLMLFLALVAVLAGDRIERVEFAFYDRVMQRQHPEPNDRVLLVATDELDADIWDASSFATLAEALRNGGASLIVPTTPAPPAADAEELEQIKALINLENRIRQVSPGDAGDTAALTDQLATLRSRLDSETRLAETLAAGNDVVVSLPRRSRGSTAAGCARFAVPASETPAAHAPLGLPGERLCKAARQAGHPLVHPDADGVVRRSLLLAGADGMLYPSLGLAAAHVLGGTEPIRAQDNYRIQAAGRVIEAERGFLALDRWYQRADGAVAFPVIRAGDIIAGDAPPAYLRNRIAIIGPVGAGAEAYPTPVGNALPLPVMVATSLSNVLENHHIRRPANLIWLEHSVMGLILLLLAWQAPRLSLPVLAAAALLTCLALLAVEGWQLASAGTWLQLVTVALFTGVSAGGIIVMRVLSGQGPAAEAASPLVIDTAARELEMSFSVLRQQNPSESTKQQLYNLAMAYGKRREFAQAERVLEHLVSLDPAFRDAALKLEKLSGAHLGVAAEASTGGKPATPPRKKDRSNNAAPGTEISRTFGRYEVESVLGHGAMATVYLGRDPKINRQVAIKTIAMADEFSDIDLDNAKRQFMREAESAGRLNHPNIIAIYDAGDDDDVAYLAMEYFEGKALNEFTQLDNLLPPKWVLELGARAAEALHYAHGQNVVHRDVKPANLLYDAATDTLKLTDFGIARLTDTSRTKTGIILGTPSYMSPEQLSATNVTGQSDLYSLGVTLYQMLAGAPPFRADSIPKLMEMIAHQPPRPLSDFRDDLPEIVNDVLQTAMAKNPAERFPNGRAMALALRDACAALDRGSATKSRIA